MTTKELENFSNYKLGLTIFFSGVALICFYLAKDIVGIFLLAAILSIAIHPVVIIAEKKKIPGLIAVIFVHLIFGSIFLLLFAQLTPVVIERVSLLLQEIPGAVQGIAGNFGNIIREEHVKKLVQEQMINYIADGSKILGGQVVGLTKNTFSAIGIFLFVFFVSGYLALDSKNIRKGFIEFFPNSYEKFANKKIDLLYSSVKKAFYGKIIVSFLLGVTILIGLWGLKVDRFLSLAILAFLLDFIPFIGSTIATIIGVIIGLSYSLLTGILVLILYLIANFIEMNITTPLFIGKEANLHPVLVLLAIGIGGSIWGLLGVIISIPLVAALVAITKSES